MWKEREYVCVTVTKLSVSNPTTFADLHLLSMNEWIEKCQSSSHFFFLLLHGGFSALIPFARLLDTFAEPQFRLGWCVYLGAVKLTFIFFPTRETRIHPSARAGSTVAAKCTRICYLWVSPLNLFLGVDKVWVQKQFFKLLRRCRTTVFVFGKYKKKKHVSRLAERKKKLQHNDAGEISSALPEASLFSGLYFPVSSPEKELLPGLPP